jgi:hypothetical protein
MPLSVIEDRGVRVSVPVMASTVEELSAVRFIESASKVH